MSAFKSLGVFFIKTAISIIAVAGILYGGNLLQNQLKDIDRQRDRLLFVEKTIKENQTTWQNIEVSNFKFQFERLRTATTDQIDREIDSLNQERTDLDKKPRASLMNAFQLAEAVAKEKLQPAIKNDIRYELIKQQTTALVELRRYAEKSKSYTNLVSEEEALRKKHNDTVKKRNENKRRSEKIATDNPNTYRLPGFQAYYNIEKVRAEWRVLNTVSLDTYAVLERKKEELLANRRRLEGVPRFKMDSSGLKDLFSPIHNTIEDSKAKTEWEIAALSGYLWLACKIVLITLCTGLLLKAILFFILAPLAARRAPVILLPKAFEQHHQQSNILKLEMPLGDRVSMKLKLDANRELIVKSEYLQSVSATARTTTKLLLNGNYPVASLASGMYLLTRVRSSEDDLVVISSTQDALSEIAAIELGDKETFVLQPRHLAGIAHRKNAPIRLFSMWRFGSVHAWLTLQFRYLVFEGPATLLVKGCRGVRVEQAQSGRIISQAATIGFSARLGYSTVRTETFIAYLLGHKALFNDKFSGNDGFFAHQEIPITDQRSGATGRSLQGLMDGLLKAFGI
jgi:hypothetical protein